MANSFDLQSCVLCLNLTKVFIIFYHWVRMETFHHYISADSRYWSRTKHWMLQGIRPETSGWDFTCCGDLPNRRSGSKVTSLENLLWMCFNDVWDKQQNNELLSTNRFVPVASETKTWMNHWMLFSSEFIIFLLKLKIEFEKNNTETSWFKILNSDYFLYKPMHHTVAPTPHL